MRGASELGFSKEHRDLNIRRIGYVASEITKNGGIAICAPIAPYAAPRRKVRELIEPVGGFFEVYVSTPLEVCEQRDHPLLQRVDMGGFRGSDGPRRDAFDTHPHFSDGGARTKRHLFRGRRL